MVEEMNAIVGAAVLVLLGLVEVCVGLNPDGMALLAFKRAVLGDPLSVLGGWNAGDASPCGWNGVVCALVAGDIEPRVVGLVLTRARLAGSIPDQMGSVQHLRHLDLSRNAISDAVPPSLFNATELRILSLADNQLSGGIPDNVGGVPKLRHVNFSNNALTGAIPAWLTAAPELRFLSLRGNSISGEIPPTFGTKSSFLEALDLSSNQLSGLVPPEIAASRYVNLSSNRLSGPIPPEIGRRIPNNATLDFSYNNLSGPVPEIGAFLNQNPQCFDGNPGLCGGALKTLCSSSVMPSDLPNVPPSTQVIPAVPGTLPEKPTSGGNSQLDSPTKKNRPLNRNETIRTAPGMITGIIFGNFAVLSLVFLAFVLWYQTHRRKTQGSSVGQLTRKKQSVWRWVFPFPRTNWDEECVSEENTSPASESGESCRSQKPEQLVMVDGESGKRIELEGLLKASVYVLGASQSSIVYRAVLEDGTALAVRRIGNSTVHQVKEFEIVVRTIAKLRHPNLVRLRGFYWSSADKLLIYDYSPNGSVATLSQTSRKSGWSSVHLKWDIRLRICRGVARGLAYLHDKKYVHANLKPSNVLLGSDMEPQIADLGMDRLVMGRVDGNYTPHFSAAGGGTRPVVSRDSLLIKSSAGPISNRSSPLDAMANHISSYQAPEALRSLKPNPKWDVYSFGMLLLELITGRPILESELAQGPPPERNRALRMVDPGLRSEVEENEEMFLAYLCLGFACISMMPQKRPTMKEVVMALDKAPRAILF